MTIRIAIADDHGLFAEGLANAVNTQPDMRTVHVSGTATELREKLPTQPADLVLIDWEMPGGGPETIAHLAARTRVIVVTMFAGIAVNCLAMEAGAMGVLSKSIPLDRLTAAIRAVHAGHFLPDDSTERTELLARFSKATLDPGAASLTEREIELLRHLARGVTATEDLANEMFISHKTVKNHLASIFVKLSVSDRTQAAIEAIRLGLAR